MLTEKLHDKCRGSLIGGAIGDALGYQVEFIGSFRAIQEKYGKEGITAYDLTHPWLKRPLEEALVSDDTQMTLYTAEAIVEAAKSGKPLLATICDAYLAWFALQVGKQVKTGYDSRLAKIDALNQRRAPGNTCLTALDDIYNGRLPHNASKGCGGIMRVAPIGITGAVLGWPLADTGLLAGEDAELTHHHKMSTLASAMQAMLIQKCICAGEPVTADTLITMVENILSQLPDMYQADRPAVDMFTQLIREAISLTDSPLHDWEIIEEKLGGGWVAEQTLAIAVFSVLRHIDDFKACMVCAVNHGGDSDSTGAVAGNILGAIVGYSAIPAELTATLQFRDLTLTLADALATLPRPGASEAAV